MRVNGTIRKRAQDPEHLSWHRCRWGSGLRLSSLNLEPMPGSDSTKVSPRDEQVVLVPAVPIYLGCR